MYGKIVNVPNLDNFLLQQLKMSRIKAQNAIWRNKNVVLQILKKKVNVINLKTQRSNKHVVSNKIMYTGKLLQKK